MSLSNQTTEKETDSTVLPFNVSGTELETYGADDTT
jgi:hypothetical protein